MRDRHLVVGLLRAETRKLFTLATVVIFVVFVAVLWQDANHLTDFAEGQAPVAVAVRNDLHRSVHEACGPGLDRTAEPCRLARLDAHDNRFFAPNGLALGQIAMSLRTLPGLMTFVAHQLATGFGWLMLALLAALHITRERSAGTLGLSVLRSGRGRYLVGKVISLFGSAIAGLTGASLVLFALRPTFTRTVRVPEGDQGLGALVHAPMRTLPPDPEWSSWAGTGRAVLCGLLIVIAICVLFALAAAVLRHPATTVVVLGGFVVGLFAVAEWGHRSTWVPLRAISAFLGIDDPPFGLADARFWDRSIPPPTIYEVAPRVPVPVASSAGWVVAWAVASILAAQAFRRRPIV